MTIEAGKLRHVIEVQRRVDVEPGDGSVEPQFTKDRSVRAQVRDRPPPGKEFMEANRVTGRATRWIVIRAYPGLTITHRLLFKGRKWNIESVEDLEERGIEMLVMVVEAV